MKIISFIVLLIISPGIEAQQDSCNTYLLTNLFLYTKIDNKNICYPFLENDKNKFTLCKSYLESHNISNSINVPIDKINKISFRDGSYGWTIAGISGAVGFAVGFYLLRHKIDFGGGSSSDEFHFPSAMIGGLLLGIPMALIGGLVGVFIPKYDDYEIYKVSKEKKYNYLKKVFKKNGIKTF